MFTEVCYLLEQRAGTHAEAAFVAELVEGTLVLEQLVREDLARIHQLVTRYADLPLGAVDASVVAVAERLNVRDVATIDVKHFTVVQPRHIPASTLLP